MEFKTSVVQVDYRRMIQCAICQKPVEKVVWQSGNLFNFAMLFVVRCHGEIEEVRIGLFDLDVHNNNNSMDFIVTVFRPKFQKCLPLPASVKQIE